MTKIICYPTSYGFEVLVGWPHAAVTMDAAWRPSREIADAKRFADELTARTYIAENFPNVPMANFVVQDAA